MFPRGKVNLFYRVLCYLAFLSVIIFIDSFITLMIVTLAFYILTMGDKRVESIYLYVITIVMFIISLFFGNYLLLRICVILDYTYYFLLVINYNEEEIEEEVSEQEIIRFKKNNKIKRKESNNMLCTIFVTVHMMILLLAIMVG